jgi:hypothetical protein
VHQQPRLRGVAMKRQAREQQVLVDEKDQEVAVVRR